MAKEHLPIYGVGPFCGMGIIAATVIGIVLSVTGVIKSGRIENTGLIAGFIVIGFAILLLGFFVWKAAALGSKPIDKYIESNTLCTTGVYSIVRNPCYSGIMLMCTGMLFMAHNLCLLESAVCVLAGDDHFNEVFGGEMALGFVWTRVCSVL